MYCMNNLTIDDLITLLWVIRDKYKKLPQLVKQALVTTLTECEVEHILSLTREELVDEVQCYGLLTKIQSLPDSRLIQEYSDRDFETDELIQAAIVNSYNSVEYLALLDQLAARLENPTTNTDWF